MGEIRIKGKKKRFKQLVRKAVSMAQNCCEINYDLDFKLEKMEPLVAGMYRSRFETVSLSKDCYKNMSDKELVKVLLHEIGHSYHHHMLGYKAQYLPRKHGGDKRYYCNSDQKESFAECFKDYVWKYCKGKKIKSNRLLKMEKILREG